MYIPTGEKVLLMAPSASEKAPHGALFPTEPALLVVVALGAEVDSAALAVEAAVAAEPGEVGSLR